MYVVDGVGDCVFLFVFEVGNVDLYVLCWFV